MNFGEADRILTILTERFGKIKAMAKGVRKTKSHLGGSLEPFMVLDLELFEGKTFYTVTGAVINEEFSSLHQDLKKISRAFYLGELVDKFLQEKQKTLNVYELFCEALRYIERENGDFGLRIFELKIIEAAGFHPELYECVHCREKLKEGENYWDSIEGGCICQDCQTKFHQGKKVSDSLIKLFRFTEKNSFSDIERLTKTSDMEGEAEEILRGYIESILERDIKSQKFLREVR